MAFEYIVEYDYDAVHEDELSIRVGDIIKNVKKLDDEGWLEGDLHGKRGAFPDNFVKENKKDAEPKEENVPKREKPGNVASLVQRMSVYGIPGIGPPPQNRSFKRKSKKRQCKVLFDYFPQNEDELELKTGDVLEITEEVEEGWWSGTYSGRSGLFPSNFVKELDLSDDAESQESSEDTEPPAAPAGASPSSPALSPGNSLEASTPTVAHPKKVMGVGFGDIFKEGSVKLKPRMPPADPEIKKPEKPSPTPPAIKATRTLSSDLPKTEVDGKAKAKETCRALYPYGALNEDELSFKEGDTIHLITKDTGDPGWWKGELNGKEGVFPDNFAAIIPDSEKELQKPKKPPPPKSTVPKPELRHGDKKFTPPKSEEKDERPSLEHKPSLDLKPLVDFKPAKPAAPLVPPKKPTLVNKSSNLVKPATIPPKRPEKPAFSTLPSKPNGESPRPKSEFEPFSRTKMDLEQILSRPKSQEVEPSTAKSPRENAPSELSFDELLPTSENLSHPTASRPKMPGKRLPGRFNGSSPQASPPTETQMVPVHHEEENESAKTPPPEVKKPSVTTSSASIFTPTPTVSKPSTTPMSPILVHNKTKLDVNDGKKSEVEEIRAQLGELLTLVDALRKEHRKEIDKLKKDLEEEKTLRSSLESEIDKLKKAVQLT
ncbi:PREDICTED: CD2-associated protein isoform X2 [Nanorana parkeri]|uniref:CD2-associated protein isoform X2 n=1 Tax=Nanorana parkeri TaxID=125878 RepID=UPI000854FC85|nr:PREDICTED: CD2-associated protein isoform X2 [Nanorana parkeri]